MPSLGRVHPASLPELASLAAAGAGTVTGQSIPPLSGEVFALAARDRERPAGGSNVRRRQPPRPTVLLWRRRSGWLGRRVRDRLARVASRAFPRYERKPRSRGGRTRRR